MFGTRWRWNATRALAVLRFERGKKVPAVPPAHARRGPARRGLPRAGGVPGERARRADRDPRPPARPPDGARLPDRGDGRRAPARHPPADRARARSASTRATRPSRRRSRTRSSTRSRTRSSTTRPSRSAARARSPSGARLPEHQRDLGALDAGRDRARRRRGATRRRATPTSSTTRCSVWSPSPVESRVASVARRAAARGARGDRASGLAFAVENARLVRRPVLRRAAARRCRRTSTGRARRATKRVLAIVRGHAEVCGPFTRGGARDAARARGVGGRAAAAAARERRARPARALHARELHRRRAVRPAPAGARSTGTRSIACAARSSR